MFYLLFQFESFFGNIYENIKMRKTVFRHGKCKNLFYCRFLLPAKIESERCKGNHNGRVKNRGLWTDEMNFDTKNYFSNKYFTIGIKCIVTVIWMITIVFVLNLEMVCLHNWEINFCIDWMNIYQKTNKGFKIWKRIMEIVKIKYCTLTLQNVYVAKYFYLIRKLKIHSIGKSYSLIPFNYTDAKKNKKM